MFSVNLTGLESTAFLECCASFPASIYWLGMMVFLSQPVSYIRGRCVEGERGKRKKSLSFGIAVTERLKNVHFSHVILPIDKIEQPDQKNIIV